MMKIKPNMMRSILIISLLCLSSCGVFKKNVEKSSSIEKKDIDIRESKVSELIDTSKIVIKSKDIEFRDITETWIWGENGVPVSYTKKTKEAISKDKQETKDNYISLISDSTSRTTDKSVIVEKEKIKKVESKPNHLKWFALVLVVFTGLVFLWRFR